METEALGQHCREHRRKEEVEAEAEEMEDKEEALG